MGSAPHGSSCCRGLYSSSVPVVEACWIRIHADVRATLLIRISSTPPRSHRPMRITPVPLLPQSPLIARNPLERDGFEGDREPDHDGLSRIRVESTDIEEHPRLSSVTRDRPVSKHLLLARIGSN